MKYQIQNLNKKYRYQLLYFRYDEIAQYPLLKKCVPGMLKIYINAET